MGQLGLGARCSVTKRWWTRQ